ncbi:MAG TPA: corrinoid protein [Candidatus Limnocylindrales bacterium]|nr:corrinoid protein [Candidatus Limnocylindrales bacterium]
MTNFEDLAAAIKGCNPVKAGELTQRLVDEGVNPSEIISRGLIAGMNVVGDLFKSGDMYVPEVMMAAKAMHAGMNIVKPLLLEGESSSTGKVVLGTVAGDLHDIGKNLVGMMMESSGLEVIDLGVDISAEKFAEAVREHRPQVLGLSALLTTTMLAMKDTMALLEKEGLRDKVKIIVGGAPVTQDFADEIGADGWAPDAASAKDVAQRLVNT